MIGGRRCRRRRRRSTPIAGTSRAIQTLSNAHRKLQPIRTYIAKQVRLDETIVGEQNAKDTTAHPKAEKNDQMISDSINFWETRLASASDDGERIKANNYLIYYRAQKHSDDERAARHNQIMEDLERRYRRASRRREPPPLTGLEIACAPLYLVYLLELGLFLAFVWMAVIGFILACIISVGPHSLDWMEAPTRAVGTCLPIVVMFLLLGGVVGGDLKRRRGSRWFGLASI